MSHQPPRYQQPVSGVPVSPPTPGYGYPMQQPPKRRKKWPWIVGGILLAGVLGCVGLFTLVLGGTAKVVSDMDENQKGQNAVAGVLNKPVTDGKFQFTVTGMKCGVAKVGPEIVSEKAQGEFCLVSISVKNVGDSAEVFVDSTQQAVDEQGATYAVDSAAGISANGEQSVFLEQINPGNVAKGKLVFDVPKGTKLTAVVLHESMFTAGAKVALS